MSEPVASEFHWPAMTDAADDHTDTPATPPFQVELPLDHDEPVDPHDPDLGDE